MTGRKLWGFVEVTAWRLRKLGRHHLGKSLGQIDALEQFFLSGSCSWLREDLPGTARGKAIFISSNQHQLAMELKLQYLAGIHRSWGFECVQLGWHWITCNRVKTEIRGDWLDGGRDGRVSEELE